MKMVNKKQVENLIYKKKENNLRNHFLTGLHRDDKNYTGEIKTHEIILWRYTWSIGYFYPILRVNFDENSNLKSVTAELNLFAKIFWIVITLLFGSIVISNLFEENLNFAIVNSIYIILFYTVGYLLSTYIFRIYKKELIEEFESKIGVTKKNNT